MSPAVGERNLGSVGGAIVVRGRESRPQGEGHQSVGILEQTNRVPTWDEVLMNIGEMQRKLSLWAERDKGRKFYGLFDLVCREDWLRLAHDHVAQNAGSKTAGCDGIDMSEFDADLDANLARLRVALRSGTFAACPVRRVYIPKSNGKVRPLGIPTVRDRIVQEAVRMVLEPIYEADFSQYSFGFRPNRRTMDAVRCILWSTTERKKYFWVIEGDISSYFDTINHRKLMSLLRKRVKDGKLLNLIWNFLRAGVMERKLFKDTSLGTPQGGVISPLLANVYLHELDRYMERYTALPEREKTARRTAGLANYVYVRYADDWVILSNGTREQVETLREELRNFLASELHLSLSMEKTKVTHLDDGFDFLGFSIRRGMGATRMGTKVLISDKGMKKHLEALQAATSPESHEDSAGLKIKAINRIIAGWCLYYQYTSKAASQFRKLAHKTFWLTAHWLGRKFRVSMTQVMKQFYKDKTFVDGEIKLCLHYEFPSLRYMGRFLKPNPYTHQEVIEREFLRDDDPWPGFEERPGWDDVRRQVMERDNYTCQLCKKAVTPETCEVDHLMKYSSFKRPVDANRPENCWTLCLDCHKTKTECDRQRESRMR
jgi:group II intron reverse transcriptase/maturase